MAFMSFLRHIGAPVDRHLRNHQLPVLCDDPDTFVPLLKVWSFFDAVAQHEDPMVGWLAGAYVGDHNLNAGLLRKLETAPTLLQALRGLVRKARAEASDIELGIYERREDVLFFTHYSGMSREPGYMISQAYQLGVFLDLIRFFLGPQWIPGEIGIEAPAIPSIAGEYLPGSRVLTQQPFGYIAIPRSCLHQSARRTGLENDLKDDLVQSQSPDYLSRLRGMLSAYLSEGYPNQQFAAELMNSSVRTLTRRLAGYGLTYGALIDALRFEKAKENLLKPDMRIFDVAQSVGFSDQGDFTRMFRRVGGVSPKQFRSTATN
jgi:AraC-like DNA-binding protein